MIKKYAAFILPISLFSFFIFKGINLPYVGQNAYNFIIYSLIAHNYNTIGYLQTKFASVISIAEKMPDNPEYFIHHPPLLSIIESLFLKVLGEDFWVGRLTVIIFAFGTLILSYYIERLFTKKLPYLALFVMALLPASTLFGKMIGQEPLVLFFMMLTVFLSLRYLKSENKKFLYGALGAVILGTLSDWPMTYFSVFLMLLFIKNKKLKIGLLLPLASAITAFIVVLWIAWIRMGFWDLMGAVQLRSFAGLSEIPYWPLLWVGTTALRIIIYFSPVFVLFSLWAVFEIYKRFVKRKFSDRDIVVVIFLIFGLFHLVLYAQASFTHPYLIYYLVPFFTFSSSVVITKLLMKRRCVILFLVTTLSIIYLFTLAESKQKQIESGVWRYELALRASKYLTPYDPIVFNKFYAIDPDIFMYPLLIPHIREDEQDLSYLLSKYKHYVYSCAKSCAIYKGDVDKLKKKYAFVRLNSPEAEVYVFFLKKPQVNSRNPKASEEIYVKTHQVKTDAVTLLYRSIRDQLKAPQL